MNARLVRGTWLLVALPLLLAAFTVARPQALPPPALPPAFDAATAEQLARELARDYPDRSPGSAGALGAATWLHDQLTLYGFPEPQEDRFTAQIPGRGRVELMNLVTVVRRSVAAQDRDHGPSGQQRRRARARTTTPPGQRRSSSSLGRTRPRPGRRVQTQPSHTLVFVSTDGGAFGALGAARFAESSRVPRRAWP